MKKNILKLFYIPIIGFSLFTLIFTFLLYKISIYETEKGLHKISENLMQEKKIETEKDVENFKSLISFFKEAIYSTSEEEMRQFLKLTKPERLLISANMIVGKIATNQKLNYSVYNNSHILLHYKNRDYLAVLINSGKKVYIIGVAKTLIDNIILNQITKYLNKYNKDRVSYIAMGKILTFSPKKDGKFGYIYYMPQQLKHLEGKPLSINKPDVKGDYYRKEYFQCLKENRPCFVKYYFKNPETGKIEQKVSYISFFKDYNLSIVKGIYKSQLEENFNKKSHFYISNIRQIFIVSIFIYLIIYFILGIILYLVLKNIKINLLNEYENLKEELEKRYYYDRYTNLPNRFKLMEDMQKLNFDCLAIMDIRDFGVINELYGYETGDKILKYFAEILSKKFNYVYKFGNDEFAIICDNHEDIGKFLMFRNVYFNKIKVEFNIGLSVIEPLIETAELALYRSKHLNKFVCRFEDNLKQEVKKQYNNIEMLRDILKNRNVIPFYQCIVDMNGKTVKYEALMRLKDKEGKILSPFMFMNEIKQSKLYDKFSFMMIKKVIADVKKYKINVSINLSFEDIENEKIKKYLLQLNENILQYITFEILESESIKSYDSLNGFISLIKQKGAKIAIDDFGSGYSNFIQILNLKTDFIKIDGSLVKNLYNEKYREIVKFMIEFSKRFNIKTIAEFVETKEDVEILKELGIDYIQGYYFCKPVPFDKISFKKGNNED